MAKARQQKQPEIREAFVKVHDDFAMLSHSFIAPQTLRREAERLQWIKGRSLEEYERLCAAGALEDLADYAQKIEIAQTVVRKGLSEFRRAFECRGQGKIGAAKISDAPGVWLSTYRIGEGPVIDFFYEGNPSKAQRKFLKRYDLKNASGEYYTPKSFSAYLERIFHAAP